MASLRRIRKSMLSLEAFIKIAFVVVIIVLFFVIASKIWAAITGSKANKDTVKNFDSLAENIQLMIDKPTSFEHQSMVVFMEEGHYAFGLIDRQTLTDYGKNPDDYPKDCKNKPCLCLYKKVKNFPKKPVKCKTFNLPTGSLVFHGYSPKQAVIIEARVNFFTRALTPTTLAIPKQNLNLYSDYPQEFALNYEHLVIAPYGTFGVLPFSDSTEKIQNFYVEKFIANDRTHIFITPFLTQDEIDKRIASLQSCPPSSDTECQGAMINSRKGSDYCCFDKAAQKCTFKQNIGECNGKITAPCICDKECVDPITLIVDWYCFKRSDGRAFLLDFDCSTVNNCADYCELRTSSNPPSCDTDETTSCNNNICGVNIIGGTKCEVKKENTIDVCKVA